MKDSTTAIYIKTNICVTLFIIKGNGIKGRKNGESVMENRTEARKRNEENAKKAAEAWAKGLIKEALKREEVEDYIYEFRWEFVNENSKQCILRVYLLWAAQVYGCSKEDMETLYKKGYRYIHKVEPQVDAIEIRTFDMNFDETASHEIWLHKFIPHFIMKTIQQDCYPPILLEEYDQLEETQKEKIEKELFSEIKKQAEEKNNEGMEQEEMLKKVQQMFPEVYKGLIKNCVVE